MKSFKGLISLALLVSMLSFGFDSFKVAAATNDEIINSEVKEVAERNDLEIVDPNLIPKDQMVDFDTVEEFEKFIKEDENVIIEADQIENNSISLFAKAKESKKLYKTIEYNGTGKIEAYARVTRKGKKVTNVVVWSEQIGIIFGITYTPNDTASYYNLNSKKTGGTAYAKGSKLYGASIQGQPVGYKKSVTYKVKF
ncbi:PI-PLC domain-containing protein [Bacillus norwichensis]|uniref:DUF5626 domain-containing protein n=1 Tax=Bacillus norwichensis TaxID=2762217 RepID=A0ABR8VS95_9BACI|nr:hypothetical protein [Bacillus norwichensis]MBD8007281.1 hypothetical protein [Bacillus norwichensis]